MSSPALLARPVNLPLVASGSSCPVTPVAQRNLGISDPRGKGPFYLGGPMPKGDFAFNKMVWVLSDGAPGPVLFRGGRLDGAGTLRFSGSRADPGEASAEPSGQLSTGFYRAVVTPASGDAFYVWPATTGCYAIQVDGPTFEDVVVIRATS